MHTYKYMHAAISKNGREGLVFPVVGGVGASKQTEQKHIWYTYKHTYSSHAHTYKHTYMHTYKHTYKNT